MTKIRRTVILTVEDGAFQITITGDEANAALISFKKYDSIVYHNGSNGKVVIPFHEIIRLDTTIETSSSDEEDDEVCNKNKPST